MADKDFEYSVNFPASGLYVDNKNVAYLESGKIPTSLLPDTILGAVQYQGTWDADTNSPDLPSATPEQGDYYVVSVAGTTSLGGITDWNVGDWAIYNGSAWQKVDNTQEIDDTPQDGVTTRSISSNWAYDHAALSGNGGHIPSLPADPTTKWLRGDGTFQVLPSGTEYMSIEGKEAGNRVIKDGDGDIESYCLRNTDDYYVLRCGVPNGTPVTSTIRLVFEAMWDVAQATSANFKLETYVRRTSFAVTPTSEDLAVPSGTADQKLALYKDYAGSTFAVGDALKFKLYKPTGLTVEDLYIHHAYLEIR